MVKIDALNIAIGSILMQDIDFDFKPVKYFSKNMSSAESRFFTHNCELFMIVSSFKRFQSYSTNIHTLVFHDCDQNIYIIF